MTIKARTIHNNYCDYQINKAKSPSRIYSVKQPVKSEIKKHNRCKALLMQELASLFESQA